MFFALEAVARGRHVTAVADGKPLTTTEAAELLGMSRTLLTRLCNEGSIPSYTVGTSLRIDADTVMTILRERGRVKTEARHAVTTAEERRRARARERQASPESPGPDCSTKNGECRIACLAFVVRLGVTVSDELDAAQRRDLDSFDVRQRHQGRWCPMSEPTGQ